MSPKLNWTLVGIIEREGKRIKEDIVRSVSEIGDHERLRIFYSKFESWAECHKLRKTKRYS